MTYLEGDAAVLPVTFTDGRRIELRSSREVDLAQLGFGTSGAVAWPVRPDGSVVAVTHTTRQAEYGKRKPIKTYQGRDGQSVPYYDGSPIHGLNLNYLVFQFGPWMVEVSDVRRPADFEAPMTDKERATWSRSLRGHVDQNGYLVLEARAPLTVEPHAFAVLGKPGVDRYVLIEEGYCGQPQSDTATPRRVSDQVGEGAAWCDPATGLHVYAAGPTDFVDVLVGGLKLQPLTPGFQAA
jgi:hypothetical protein